MKIPDPIYDQYYFSSPENQEAILRVVENLITEQKKEFMEKIKKEINKTEFVEIHLNSKGNGGRRFYDISTISI